MIEVKDWLSEWSQVPLLIACAGLVAATFFEQSQLIAKSVGAQRGIVATGYNNAMKLMVANRLGAVAYFFMISLSIDFETPPETIQRSLAVTVMLVGLSSAVLMLFYRSRVGEFEDGKGSWLWTRGNLQRSQKIALWGALGATIFNLAGLTIPMIWSATYPELRLTLANTGFLFNSIFTFLNVFIVESEVARQIDRDADNMHDFIFRLLQIKFLAALAAIPIVLLP